MPRSKSSKRWLQEHFNDPFVKKAQLEGYRSRAVYKLSEIDQKEHLIAPNMTVVDLGAAPGGWTQYIAKIVKSGKIFALDILPMDPISGVEIIQGDFQEESVYQELLSYMPAHSVDLVLSDMAPNMSGNHAVDIPKAMYLAELAYEFSTKMLKPNGALVIKIFHGEGCDELIKNIRSSFKKITIRKPQASRPRSRETYLLAKGYNL
jgi:23S rRNA (uridine2552-2'-O)-methyltransferase